VCACVCVCVCVCVRVCVCACVMFDVPHGISMGMLLYMCLWTLAQ
jgi:hypothetical protein